MKRKKIMSSEIDQVEKKRQELEKASIEARQEIIEEFEKTKEDAEHIIKKILVIGGGLLVSYFFFKTLFGGDESAENTDKKKVRS